MWKLKKAELEKTSSYDYNQIDLKINPRFLKKLPIKIIGLSLLIKLL